MEEKAKNAVKTFEDLAQAVADSGRPYDAGRIEHRITESKAKKE